MPRRTKPQSDEVPLARARRSLAELVRRLPAAQDGRIALTVRGEVRAWLVWQPPPEVDDEPTRMVARLVKRALKTARE